MAEIVTGTDNRMNMHTTTRQSGGVSLAKLFFLTLIVPTLAAIGAAISLPGPAPDYIPASAPRLAMRLSGH
jgi:hypothetical protein